jgi:outer membrane protein assembly factor BamB/tRNA A-37 threonylcarbamoyl transferase component Bud32
MERRQESLVPSEENRTKEGALRPGTVLQQRYEILGVRGSGGMAIVYRARDLRFEKVSRICAVKEMYNTAPEARLRDLIRQSFEREANVLALLSHPAIPHVVDYFTDRDHIYLVMEFVDGEDLESLIDHSPEPLAPEVVTDWAIQICDVLDYLHNHDPPFIFRDLKPTNIMVNLHGQIRLIDFGIAKVFERGQRGTMIGTAGYPPPEQYRGLAEPRGDLYALGATMHHLLTKRDPRQEPPFSFHEHPIREANPKVSATLDAIVMKALEYDIEKRFASAQEMRAALEASRRPPAEQAAPVSTVALSPVETPVTSTEEIAPYWVFACEDEVRSSPTVSDGVVYVGSYDYNLYAVDAQHGKFVWKYPTEDVISSSPYVWDELVLFGSEDHALYALFKDTGRIAWSAPTKDRVRSSPRVALDHAFFGSDDCHFYCVSARDGRQMWSLNTGSFVRSSPAASREHVFFGTSDGSVYALDLLTGKQRWRFTTNRTVISSPLLHDDVIYVGSMDWNLYALDAQAGWSLWSYRTQGWVVSNPSISEALGLVYVGSADGSVYAIERDTGRKAWSYETGGPVTSSPVVADGAVYIGSTDGRIYSLDAKRGDLRWKYDTGGSVVSSPTVSEGTVFVGSRNKHLYAFPL